MKRGVQYLRELAVLEVIYYDLNNAQSPTDPGTSPVHTAHVVEICMECTIIVCQLIGSNDLER